MSRANPEVTIMSPPAILSDSMLIPKKCKMNLPVKNEIKRITKMFTAVNNEVLERSEAEYSCVNPTKIGTVPKGFITENNAANT